MKTELNQIATIFLGYPLRESPESLKDGECRFIQLKNVDIVNGIDWQTVPSVSLPQGHSQAFLQEGDVIFSARGLRNYAYTIIAPPEYSVCAPHFFIIRIKKMAKILPQFLTWQINQTPVQNHLIRTKTGAVTPTIRKEELQKLPIIIPPINKQRQIIAYAETASKEQKTLLKMIENQKNQMEALAFNLHKQSMES